MKLLGWMHRKLRQNTNETTPKDFPMDDMLQCYQKGNHGVPPPFGKAQRGNYRNSFEDDDDITIDLFHGFLAIGTLGGTEQFSTTTDPPTPTFSSISEKETQATETELKLINDELEKVLLLEDDDVMRMSCCSAVTLSGKPNIESADTCPLQSYLFGSAVDTAPTPPPPQQQAKRTSLGDLFQKTSNYNYKHHHHDSKNDKSAVHVVKKMLKKTIDSDKKLHKILQMFNRKVHPAADFSETNKAATKGNNVVGSRSEHQTHQEDIIIYPQQEQEQEQAGAATGNHEFWVKTDADYLVLEL